MWDFDSLLLLDRDWNIVWQRHIWSCELLGDTFVCVTGVLQAGMHDVQDNLAAPINGPATSLYVGLDTTGRERWRRFAEANVSAEGIWRGAVVGLNLVQKRPSPRGGNSSLHIFGLRAKDGKVVWGEQPGPGAYRSCSNRMWIDWIMDY